MVLPLRTIHTGSGVAETGAWPDCCVMGAMQNGRVRTAHIGSMRLLARGGAFTRTLDAGVGKDFDEIDRREE